MKLKLPAVFSQRNPIWVSDLLGYNTNPVYSIGGFGCLITSFGMYVNEQPNNVNKKLQDNGGYVAGGGNFIWSKCSVLGLTQVYQSPYYSDAVTTQGLAKMKALLDEGRPLITHIDFDPRDPDDDQHWILVYGYEDNDVFLAADPWTGTLINLDVYGGVKRAVLEWRAYDKILPKDEGVDCEKLLQQAVDDRNRNWDWILKIKDALIVSGDPAIDVLLRRIDMLIGIERDYGKLQQANSENQSQISGLKTQLASATADSQKLKDDIGALKDEMTKKTDELLQTIQGKDATIKQLTASVQELEKRCQTQPTKSWLEIVLEHLFGR
jgi:hypothetical protein